MQVPADAPIGTTYSIMHGGKELTITVAEKALQQRQSGAKQASNNAVHALARTTTQRNLTFGAMLGNDEFGLSSRFLHFADLVRIFSGIFRAGLAKYFGECGVLCCA